MDKENSGVEDFLKLYGAKDREYYPGLGSPDFYTGREPSYEPYGPSSSTSTIRGTLGDFTQPISSRGRSNSSASQWSSTLTSLSTAPSLPPFPLPDWHSYQYNMAQPEYEYDLPCEFHMLGCYVKFSPGRYGDWITHSLSHFLGHGPPSKTVCTFCDDTNAYVHDPYDSERTWRARMMHIGGHHQENGGALGHRPDYHLLKHLKRYNLIDDDSYRNLMSYTERHDTQKDRKPYKELYLVDDDYQTPEMVARERRNPIADDGPQDVKGEERHCRPEKEKGKGKEKQKERSGRTHKTSRKPDKYY